MKGKYFFLAAAALTVASCHEERVDGSAALLSQIERLYEEGRYKETLDSIESLRERFPKATEARRRALCLWQEASLRMAQQDIADTDSALQATTAAMNAETRIYERNMLGVKRDSLQARYEAMIGVVRMIRKRMEETHE